MRRGRQVLFVGAHLEAEAVGRQTDISVSEQVEEPTAD